MGSSGDRVFAALGACDRTMGSVPAVARLGQRVGRERGELLGLHQLVDHVLEAGGVGQVEVVDGLRALVAKVAVALESRRSCHVGGGSSGCGPIAPMDRKKLSCVSMTPYTCSGRYASPVSAARSRMYATASAPPMTTGPGDLPSAPFPATPLRSKYSSRISELFARLK